MISSRLRAIFDKIDNKSIADIGTDHGLLPYYLLENEKVDFAILTDIGKKPLNKAKTIFKNNQLKEKCSFRLGSGLEVIEDNEVDTVVIAGMGGEMIAKILNNDLEKAHSFKKFIFQPMTKSNTLREFLSNNHFRITSEEVVYESKTDKFFEILTVENGEMPDFTEMDARFGYKPVRKENEDYFNYLKLRKDQFKNQINSMENSTNQKTIERRFEIKRCFDYIEQNYESI